MLKKTGRFTLHLIIFVILTVTTQIGGIVYAFVSIFYRKKSSHFQLKRALVFFGIYLATTLFIVPFLAPFFGREKIENTDGIKPRSYFYVLANRNYVRPELNTSLASIAKRFQKQHPNVQIQYLDANFPFINKFPLLPHLSHNDGKKLDISFVYEDTEGISNSKPSVSGYGIYEEPKRSEFNQTVACKSKGYWQYDFPKYLTLGNINSDLVFSKEANRDLLRAIISEEKIGKIFIEPHLKSRLRLSNSKIRFHGCQAVRHDDHVHLQLK